MARIAMVVVTAAVGLAGCGGDDPGEQVRKDPSTPVAEQERPDQGKPEVAPESSGDPAEDRRRAEQAYADEDYDSAIALMQAAAEGGDAGARRALEHYRATASKAMVRNAKRKLREAKAADISPRAAVSQAQVALRYDATPEARAVHAEAERALADYRRRQRSATPPAGDDEAQR